MPAATADTIGPSSVFRRVVPRPDDQAAPARLAQHARTGAQRHQRRRARGAGASSAQVPLRMADLVDHRQQLGQVDLHRRLAAGPSRRRRTKAARRPSGIEQPAELGAALGDAAAAKRQCHRPLAREQGVDPGLLGIVVGFHGSPQVGWVRAAPQPPRHDGKTATQCCQRRAAPR